jgi:hypothetical protein
VHSEREYFFKYRSVKEENMGSVIKDVSNAVGTVAQTAAGAVGKGVQEVAGAVGSAVGAVAQGVGNAAATGIGAAKTAFETAVAAGGVGIGAAMQAGLPAAAMMTSPALFLGKELAKAGSFLGETVKQLHTGGLNLGSELQSLNAKVGQTLQEGVAIANTSLQEDQAKVQQQMKQFFELLGNLASSQNELNQQLIRQIRG